MRAATAAAPPPCPTKSRNFLAQLSQISNPLLVSQHLPLHPQAAEGVASALLASDAPVVDIALCGSAHTGMGGCGVDLRISGHYVRPVATARGSSQWCEPPTILKTSEATANLLIWLLWCVHSQLQTSPLRLDSGSHGLSRCHGGGMPRISRTRPGDGWQRLG